MKPTSIMAHVAGSGATSARATEAVMLCPRSVGCTSSQNRYVFWTAGRVEHSAPVCHVKASVMNGRRVEAESHRITDNLVEKAECLKVEDFEARRVQCGKTSEHGLVERERDPADEALRRRPEYERREASIAGMAHEVGGWRTAGGLKKIARVRQAIAEGEKVRIGGSW
jgi:hypothetical protein